MRIFFIRDFLNVIINTLTLTIKFDIKIINKFDNVRLLI